MRIIRHPRKSRLKSPVVALGNFDGVHRGHQRVISAAVARARQLKTHSAVITFDPHPQEVVAPERGLRLLTTLAEREAEFLALGVDSVVVINFSHQLKERSYTDFVKNYLVNRLGIRQVFIGYDYAFGRGRSGSVQGLKKLGRQFGFQVSVIPPVKVVGRPAKSGWIRELLSRGEFATALKFLGHPYIISGRVVRGRGVGRRLGFPTANLELDPRKLIPAQGVYFGRVSGIPGSTRPRKCLVNIGSRPTFGQSDLLVEVHLLHYRGNLLGRRLKVELFSRLREERQFADADKLKAQIKKDVVRATKMCYNH